MPGLSQDLHILRLGYGDRVNFVPLLYPVAAGWSGPQSPWKMELKNGTPSTLLQGLLSGDLDAAFVPPAVLMQRGANLQPLGSWCLATEGTAGTGLLLARERLDGMDGEVVAISDYAQGSTAEHILKTLLKPYYSIDLRFLSPGDPDYSSNGSRLALGDDAARDAQKLPEAWVAEDMGKAWWIYSGLPAVWEMLAVSRDLEARKPGASDAIQATLRLSQRTAQEQSASLLEEAAGRLGVKRDDIKALFALQRYNMGDREQKGLAYFLDAATRARALGR